ncbi:MAG: TM1812 family CRISPR-associated protein [Fibrobacter sp.]|nr:TM1812 family CRISPR-associated protein [Fibrobacter sp.]
MKIVFVNIPMKKASDPKQYPVDGNSEIEYEGNVRFPINAVLAKSLKKGESVKIVKFITKDSKNNYLENSRFFNEELDLLNQGIGANIQYNEIIEEYSEDLRTHENRFRKLINELEDGADILVDITYGQKTLPVLLFSALSFAEKFYNANIQNIIYGKINYDSDNNIIDGSQKIYDITSLYYLNTLTASMEAPNGETAKKMIDNFFEM